MKQTEIQNAFAAVRLPRNARQQILNACTAQAGARPTRRFVKPIRITAAVCACAAFLLLGVGQFVLPNHSGNAVQNSFTLMTRAMDANGEPTESPIPDSELRDRHFEIDSKRQDWEIFYLLGDDRTRALWAPFDFFCKGDNIDTVTFSSEDYLFAPMAKRAKKDGAEYTVVRPRSYAHSFSVAYDKQNDPPYQIGLPLALQDPLSSEVPLHGTVTVTVQYKDGTSESKTLSLYTKTGETSDSAD